MVLLLNIDIIKGQGITVYTDSVTGEISPLLYGTGFENFGNEINLGLWADMIDGKSMEGDANNDGLADKWIPVGEGTNVISYYHDPVDPLNTDYSQKIQITSFTNGYGGIAQEGLNIETGKTYSLGLFLRQNNLEGNVTVSLVGEYGTYDQVVFDSIPVNWTKYSAILTSSATVADAQLQITFTENGILWVDQVVLMPENNYLGHGTRLDIMEKLVQTRPTSVRWPGGLIAEQYDWRDGIGDKDDRPTTLVYASDVRNQWYPELVPNQFGTDEFMQFLEDIGGAEPILSINSGYAINGPLPEEYITNAVNWVEYCNGDVTTPFGNLRAANGHLEPYNVKYWNIGNEPWQISASDYANRFVQFATAMKEKDPSILLIAEDGNQSSQWRTNLLQVAGEYMDFLSIHRYYRNGYINSMSYPNYVENNFNNIKNIIDSYVPGNNILISFNEWNNNTNVGGGNALGWTLKEGLFAAGMFNSLERISHIVYQSGVWPLFRGDAAYQYIPYPRHNLIHYDNQRLFTSPTYLTLDLYRANYAPNKLAVDVVSNNFNTYLVDDVPYLDAVATKNEANDRLILKVVNKSGYNEMITSVTISGNPEPDIDSIASVYLINSANITDMNTLTDPNVIEIDSFSISGVSSNFEYTFPAHSITVIVLTGFFPSHTVSVVEKDDNLTPGQFMIYQNYPNPFNTETVIQYELPLSVNVLLEIYDITGGKVKTLVNEKQSRGYKTVSWNGRDDKSLSVPSGLYFSLLTGGNATVVNKMMLIK